MTSLCLERGLLAFQSKSDYLFEKKMRSFLLGLLILTFGSAIFPSINIDKNLVAHFTFNRCDAQDDSGHNNRGELKGNVQCWCGVEDEGLLFDGKDAHVVFSGEINQVFTTSDFTISVYFKAQNRSIFPSSFISKRTACDDEHILDIMLNQALGEITTDFKESEFKFFKELTPELKSNEWMHFALVREGFYARAYINGSLVKESRRCSGIDISNDAPFSIGNSPCIYGGRAQRFQGVVDELRVYDRALSDEEILFIYDLTPIENAQMDCYS